MSWFTDIRTVHQEGGVKAVGVAIVDRLRQVLSRDFRPMVAYAETPDTAELSSESDLLPLLEGHQGNVVTKWHHYLDIYEAHFSRFRGTDVRFLEIGVFKGGSLDIWRKYFGPEATIFGIDIEPDCARFDGISGSVRIGSQADPQFLQRVVDEMGGLDVVLDDGSHNSRHIRKTLKFLYPQLQNDGVYMIEDLHCAYLPRFGGGFRWPWSFMSDVKVILDDMHHWYHGRAELNQATAGAVYAMHLYDSIVVLDKKPIPRPISFQRPIERT
jgi:hypothetical protein